MGTKWSASAYVAGRPSFDASGLQCTVSGVFRSPIVELVDQGNLDFEKSDEEMWEGIRSWRPAVASLNDNYLTGERIVEVYCRILVWDDFSDEHLSYTKSLKSLEKVWCGDESSSKNEFSRELEDHNSYYRSFRLVMRNQRLFALRAATWGFI